SFMANSVSMCIQPISGDRRLKAQEKKMPKVIVAAAIALLIVVGAAAMRAAPDAPQTAYPGQMTQARVWVQNRGESEAVPVDVRALRRDKPIRVHVVNGDSGLGGGSNPVQVRGTRQVWEYETVVVPQRTDVAAVLNTRGGAGWEAVGLLSATA